MNTHDSSVQAVYSALVHRLEANKWTLLKQYNVNMVLDAVERKAESFEGRELEEIGSSDVSCWYKDIEEELAREAAHNDKIVADDMRERGLCP